MSQAGKTFTTWQEMFEDQFPSKAQFKRRTLHVPAVDSNVEPDSVQLKCTNKREYCKRRLLLTNVGKTDCGNEELAFLAMRSRRVEQVLEKGDLKTDKKEPNTWVEYASRHAYSCLRKDENRTRNQTRGPRDHHRHFPSWTDGQEIRGRGEVTHLVLRTHSQRRSPSFAVECKISHGIRVDVMLIPKRAYPSRKLHQNVARDNHSLGSLLTKR